MVIMAKQIITDEESKLKRQARRRLIGAIALTILVVVLLPMVLDREPPAPSQDIDLQIPDKDKVGEFVPKMVLPPLDVNEAASQPVSAPVIAPLLDVQPSLQWRLPRLKPSPGLKPGQRSKPARGRTEDQGEQKSGQVDAKAKTESKPAVKTGSAPHSGFRRTGWRICQCRCSEKLQEKLLKQGYPSYTEKAAINSRAGRRLCHPCRSRESAAQTGNTRDEAGCG